MPAALANRPSRRRSYDVIAAALKQGFPSPGRNPAAVQRSLSWPASRASLSVCSRAQAGLSFSGAKPSRRSALVLVVIVVVVVMMIGIVSVSVVVAPVIGHRIADRGPADPTHDCPNRAADGGSANSARDPSGHRAGFIRKGRMSIGEDQRCR